MKGYMEKLGMSFTTAKLMELEKTLGIPISEIGESKKLSDMVKTGSAISGKTVPEVCAWIDENGLDVFSKEIAEVFNAFSAKKA